MKPETFKNKMINKFKNSRNPLKTCKAKMKMRKLRLRDLRSNKGTKVRKRLKN